MGIHPALVLVLGLAAAGVTGALLWAALRSARQPTPARAAAAAGLGWSPIDTYGATAAPFDLLRSGTRRSIEDLVFPADQADGPLPPSPVAFALTIVTVTTDAEGGETTRTRRHRCALVRLDQANVPALRLDPENAITRAAGRIGLRDFDTESDEFNQRYLIQPTDRRFATAFLDPGVMSALLAGPADLAYDVRGRWVLAVGPWLGSGPLVSMVPHLADLANRLPSVIGTLWPAPRGADGDVLPPIVHPPPLDLSDDEAGDRLWSDSVSRVPEPGADDRRPYYDLDGNLVTPVEEDPWGPGRPMPRRPAPPAGPPPSRWDWNRRD